MRRDKTLCCGLIIAGVMLYSTGCAAQPSLEPEYQVVYPGSDQLDPSRIVPHQVRYERPGGFMNYDLHLANLDGVEVYELYVYFNTEEEPPDKMYFDPSALGFVGRTLVMPAYTVDVRFTNGQFTGVLTPGENSDLEPVTYDRAYPHGGFEPAVVNYWITALPLEEGYTASLPIFDLSNGSGLFWANIEVLQREMLEVDGVQYDTWKVESRGMRKKTIWVSTTDPFMIKMITQGSSDPWILARQ